MMIDSRRVASPIAGSRIMVIGQDVLTVQRVSRCCLEQGAEVLPYYGLPSYEEVLLFNPEFSILCLPLSDAFLPLNHPYVVWADEESVINQEEQPKPVRNCEELENWLQTLKSNLSCHP